MPLDTRSPARLVLDTNVWLDLLVFADPRCALLKTEIDSARACVLLDQHCHDEWQRVVSYPALRLDLVQQAALVTKQRALCEWIEDDPGRPAPALPRCRDPDDQRFLQLAWRGRADCVLSRDLALLELDGRCRKRQLFAILSPHAWRGPA
jgi:putative PIN family toxin of toxin-antitoxin system